MMYRIVSLVSLLVLSSALPDRQQQEIGTTEVPTDRFENVCNQFVQALDVFLADTQKEISVMEMKQRCDMLREGAGVVAEEVTAMEKSLGIKSEFETEDQELAAATNKLKQIVKTIAISEEDLLELIVGDGTMGVDHHRLTLSLNLLEKMNAVKVRPDLDALVQASGPVEVRRTLDDLKASLDGVSTVLDGIVDILDDADVTAQKEMEPEKPSPKTDQETVGDDMGIKNDKKKDGSSEENKISVTDQDALRKLDRVARSVNPNRKLHRVRRRSWSLGRGWSIGTGGLTYQRRNFRFNAKPTYSGGSLGARATWSWRW